MNQFIDIRDNPEQVVLPDAQLPLFSPDGTLILTLNDQGDWVILWDVQTGQMLASVKGDSIRAFSPDGALLATHNADDISLWDVDALIDGSASPLTVLPADNPNIQEIAFNPDGTLLFVRDASGVSLWGIPTS